MVDLTFIGIDPKQSMTLTDLPLSQLAALLSAPSMPFDGMNEYGLTVGMAAVPDQYLDDASYDPARPTIGSIGIIRQVLDHARDVDEALEIFRQYNIDFSGGPPIHYLIADPSGKAVLVEFYQGEMVLLPNEEPWHMATNHLRCIARGDGGCQRYHTLSDRLTSLNGQLDPQAAMQLLSEVNQDMTQWSSVYNMTSGDINVVIAGLDDTVYSFHLDLRQP
jgi:predicted choloylglycine hydrolase